MPTHAHFLAGYFDPTVGQTDLVFFSDEGSLVGLRTQDSQVSVCSGYTTCTTVVDPIIGFYTLTSVTSKRRSN